MDREPSYGDYIRSAQQASELVERGDYDGAITILRDLLSTDISDVDKSMMCLNMAIVYEKMGKAEEALTWYSSGIDYERRHGRSYVAELKAAFLANHGRDRESLAEYEELLGRPELTENDKERIRHDVAILRSRVP